jgi:PBP1b-binding outer membrane lipoprotein LpoB
MKKMVWPIIAGILLLSACQNSEPKAEEVKTKSEKPQQQIKTEKDNTFPYPNLLAEKPQNLINTFFFKSYTIFPKFV